MKNTKKKRCEFCRQWFLPDYRTLDHQYCCSSELCRRLRKLNTYRQWLLRHPNYDEYRRNKIRIWAKKFPSYWRMWRENHPEYKKREKKRVCHKPDGVKNGAKQDVIAPFTVYNFNNTLQNMTKILAKQSLIIRRTNTLFQTFFGNFPSQNKTI